MSASASNADTRTSTTNQQQSTQGASGAGSPTITAAGGVTYNDQSGLVAQESLGVIQSLVGQALNNSASVNSGALTELSNLSAQREQSNSQNDLSAQNELSQLIGANALTTTTQGTGGLNLTSKTFQYILIGAVALVGLFFLTRKS